MPQLNPLDWGPQLIWLVITFGILYLLMVHVVLPRIGGVLEARAAHIAKDLAAADKLRRETEEAIAAYEQALAEAKQKAHAIIDAGRTKLKEEMAAERAKLDQELGKKSAEAEARINEAKASAMKDVSAVAADVAADIVRQLIGSVPSKAEIEKAMQASAERLSHGLHLRAGILGRRIVLPVPRRRALFRRAQEARRGARCPRSDRSPRSSTRPSICAKRPRRCSPITGASRATRPRRLEAIIELASKEAEELAAETRRSMAEHFERRMKLAEDKIARAETEALREVRAAAADAAVAAAQTIIAAKLTPETADALVKQGISALKSKLN